MSQEVYVKLIERMNLNIVKHQQTQARIKYLQELYTEEQAVLIADFPLGAYTVKALSEKMNRDEGELKKMLVQMSADGLIFEAKNENAEPEYSVLAFEPGFSEVQIFRAFKDNDDTKIRRLMELIEQMGQEDTAVMEELFKNPEALEEAKKAAQTPIGRLVPIEETVSNDMELASWEKLSKIIEKETSYAVAVCGCKEIAKQRGEPCQSGVNLKCCIWFGKAADYLVERDLAERYTKESVYKRIKECQDAGLVQFTMNRMMPENIVICNCCKCCCAYLKVNKEFREAAGIPLMQNTNFVSQVDEETCTGCGECVDHCQLEALEMHDDMVRVNEQYCLGCGACVSICPTGSLSLARISQKKPPEPEIKIVGSGV
jgi:ferredoxin